MDAEKIIGTHAFDEIFDARVISNKNLKKAWKTREIKACSYLISNYVFRAKVLRGLRNSLRPSALIWRNFWCTSDFWQKFEENLKNSSNHSM